MIQQKEKFSLLNWELVSVNPTNKNWNWFDLFCLWGNNIQSLIGFSLIAALYLSYDLNSFVVLTGTLIAVFLVYIFSSLIGRVSQKYGIPFPVVLRPSMGVNGARYVAMLRGLVGVFMFGVQTFFISKSFGYLIRILIFSFDKSYLEDEIFLFFLMGMDVVDWFAFIFTLLFQYLLFTNGQLFNKKIINFSAIFVYFGLIFFLIIVISENYQSVLSSLKLSLTFNNFISKNNVIPILSVSGTLFAYFSIVIINFGDYSRYVKDESQLNKGNLSLILNLILFSLLSVSIVVGSDIILTQNFIKIDQLLTNPTDIIGKFNNIYLTIVALFFILTASISTNLIANYIPSQNSLLNFFPKSFSLKGSGLTITIIGFFVGSFWLAILSQIGILSLIDTVGCFFGPLFGIIVSDYYLIRNKNFSNKDLFSSSQDSMYFYSNGWQIKGIYSLFIGFIFSASTIWNSNLVFLQPFSFLIGAFISYLTYYLLSSE